MRTRVKRPSSSTASVLPPQGIICPHLRNASMKNRAARENCALSHGQNPLHQTLILLTEMAHRTWRSRPCKGHQTYMLSTIQRGIFAKVPVGSHELAVRLPHHARETQLPCWLAVRRQYRELGEAPILTGDDSTEIPGTLDALLTDIILHHQRPSSLLTATPELTPGIPSGNTTPHCGQPSQGRTITIRHGRQV